MSKPKFDIRAWLGEKFSFSHKAISESLTAEQYNQFAQEAEKLAEGDTAGDGPQDADPEKKIEASDAKAPEVIALEGQVSTLQTQLGEAKNALADEKTAHTATSAKLTETEGKLKLSEDQKDKLRQAVNPLADEDLTNKDSADNKGLTQSDIDARAAYKKNNPTA